MKLFKIFGTLVAICVLVGGIVSQYMGFRILKDYILMHQKD